MKKWEWNYSELPRKKLLRPVFHYGRHSLVFKDKGIIEESLERSVPFCVMGKLSPEIQISCFIKVCQYDFIVGKCVQIRGYWQSLEQMAFSYDELDIRKND
jgi:hypothetical protein